MPRGRRKGGMRGRGRRGGRGRGWEFEVVFFFVNSLVLINLIFFCK